MNTNIKYRKKHISNETKVNIVSDYKAGLPINEIKARYHISHTAIYNYLKQAIQPDKANNDRERSVKK